MIKLLISILVVFTTVTKSNSQHLYKTPSGKKYHLASCRMVENVSEKITKEQAIKLGLGACKICWPEIPNTLTTITQTAKETNNSVQCRGVTKSGTRCRHLMRIANPLCYQHADE